MTELCQKHHDLHYIEHPRILLRKPGSKIFIPPFSLQNSENSLYVYLLVSAHLSFSASSHSCSHLQSRDNPVPPCQNNFRTQLFTYIKTREKTITPCFKTINSVHLSLSKIRSSLIKNHLTLTFFINSHFSQNIRV